MSFPALLFTLLPGVLAAPSPQGLPPGLLPGLLDSFMGEITTGIFGSGKATSPPSFNAGSLAGLSGAIGMLPADTTGGSGPYTAYFAGIPDLPKHTIFQPKVVPPGEKLPVILWGMFPRHVYGRRGRV
jgi:hypothetical protein